MSGLSRQLRYLVGRHAELFRCSCVRSNYLPIGLGQRPVKSETAACNFGTLTQCSSTNCEPGLIKVAPISYLNINQRRFKKKRAQSSKNEEDDDDEEEEGDDLASENPLLVDDILGEANDGSETLTINVNSLRLDAVCKTAFSVTRAKVEESLYKGDIRINGELPIKKSVEVMTGDEVDMFKSSHSENPNLIIIRKALISSIPDKATEHGRMKIKIKRWMDLTVEKPRSTA